MKYDENYKSLRTTIREALKPKETEKADKDDSKNKPLKKLSGKQDPVTLRPDLTEVSAKFPIRRLGTRGFTEVYSGSKYVVVHHSGNMRTTEKHVEENFDKLHHKGAYKSIRSHSVASGSPSSDFTLKIPNKKYYELKSAKQPVAEEVIITIGGYTRTKQVNEGKKDKKKDKPNAGDMETKVRQEVEAQKQKEADEHDDYRRRQRYRSRF